MGWEAKGKPQTVKITEKLAKEWAAMDAAHTDRPLSERRLQVYEKMLREGEFRPVAWAKVFCKETNQWYRVNGKHTSTLFAGADLSKFGEHFAVVEEYECDALEDVAKLYSTFDSKTQIRSATDVYRSFQSVIPELAPLPVKIVNLVISGLAWHNNPTQPMAETTPERAERLFDHIPVCLWVNDMLHAGDADQPGRFLHRATVVGAMIGCYYKARGPATEFWRLVRDDEGEKASLPHRKLTRFLLTNSVLGASGSHRPNRLVASQREFYAKCVHAWNAWRKNEPTNLNYFADRKLPAII